MDIKIAGEHVSQVVAPLLAAFTLPTIAVVGSLPWRQLWAFSQPHRAGRTGEPWMRGWRSWQRACSCQSS